MRVIRIGMSAVIAIAFVSSGMMVLAQSNSGTLLEKYHPLISNFGEYYVFMDDRKQVTDYRDKRTTRVCTGSSRHQIPLAVTADDNRLELAGGECVLLEAKSVYLEPARPLDPKSMIRVDVATLATR